jgi:hypothetical protein
MGGWKCVHSARRPLNGLSYLPLVIVMTENLVEWRLAGETEVLGNNLPQRHFIHHKSHFRDPGSNPGRRGGKPATTRLSYCAVSHNKKMIGLYNEQVDRIGKVSDLHLGSIQFESKLGQRLLSRRVFMLFIFLQANDELVLPCTQDTAAFFHIVSSSLFTAIESLDAIHVCCWHRR